MGEIARVHSALVLGLAVATLAANCGSTGPSAEQQFDPSHTARVSEWLASVIDSLPDGYQALYVEIGFGWEQLHLQPFGFAALRTDFDHTNSEHVYELAEFTWEGTMLPIDNPGNSDTGLPVLNAAARSPIVVKARADRSPITLLIGEHDEPITRVGP